MNDKNNINGNIYESFQNKKKLTEKSNQLVCNNEYKLFEFNEANMNYNGNNINKDILTQIQVIQDNTNDELHEFKKINYPALLNAKSNEKKYLINNKNEMNGVILFKNEKKINKEKGKDNLNKKMINIQNSNNNIKISNYKDIPLTSFFHKKNI